MASPSPVPRNGAWWTCRLFEFVEQACAPGLYADSVSWTSGGGGSCQERLRGERAQGDRTAVGGTWIAFAA